MMQLAAGVSLMSNARIVTQSGRWSGREVKIKDIGPTCLPVSTIQSPGGGEGWFCCHGQIIYFNLARRRAGNFFFFNTCLHRTVLAVKYLFPARNYLFQKYSSSPLEIKWWPPYRYMVWLTIQWNLQISDWLLVRHHWPIIDQYSNLLHFVFNLACVIPSYSLGY